MSTNDDSETTSGIDVENFNPVYQKGKADVPTATLDAAGENHPLGDEVIPFETDSMRRLIRKIADKLYQSWEACIREYLANAETACLRVVDYVENNTDSTIATDSLHGVDDGYEPRIEVVWDRSEMKLYIRDNGVGIASVEMKEIFTKVSHSAARDFGNYSGQFGFGVLSFPKFIGVYDSGVISTHSRQTDENYCGYLSLSGVEPLMGQMSDNEYGTRFQFSAKDDYDVRSAVEKYAEWMRVPVLYTEYDENGSEVFNEDYGDTSLTDKYGSRDVTIAFDEYSEYFEAYCSDKASGETLLLSMPIERNGKHESTAPFDYDIRFFDESGTIFKSTNGNEGRTPVPRRDFEQMLLDAREPYLPTSTVADSEAVVGQVVADGPHSGQVAVTEAVLESDTPLPANEYVEKSELVAEDIPGDVIVLAGDDRYRNRIVVSDDEWDEMEEGRASGYVPEDEVEPFDLDSGEGDLQLPEPTSNRDSLQQHDVFWKWLAQNFKESFEKHIFDVHERITPTDNPAEDIAALPDEDIVKTAVEVSNE